MDTVVMESYRGLELSLPALAPGKFLAAEVDSNRAPPPPLLSPPRFARIPSPAIQRFPVPPTDVLKVPAPNDMPPPPAPPLL
mmetsp:Transcript_10205/g.29134  ORF Transcript_10205/g.29134 Transcript_10205/m.29134 type:complete len:82 (-) Transcript_10205:1742-1987(-)